MFTPLDGPATQGSLSVTASTVQEAKTGASRLTERQVVTIQSDKDLYVYFGDSTASAPSTTTVQANGFRQYKDSIQSYEAGDKQPIYILSVSGTAQVKISERA